LGIEKIRKTFYILMERNYNIQYIVMKEIHTSKNQLPSFDSSPETTPKMMNFSITL
jgi:hypothetical protein